MRRKEVLFAAVIGGIVGASSGDGGGVRFAPLGAQQRSSDGPRPSEYITCRGLTVVDSDGEARVSTGVAEARCVVGVINNGGMASLSVNELGGIVLMLNESVHRVFDRAAKKIGERSNV